MRYWLLPLLAIAPLVGCGKHADKPRRTVYSRAEVVRPRKKELVRTLHLSATVEALQKVDLYARVPGYVQMIQMDIGKKVLGPRPGIFQTIPGEVLVQLTAPDLEAELLQKKAMAEQAESQLELARESLKVAIREVTEVAKEHKKFLAEHAFARQRLARIADLVRQRAQDALLQQEAERQVEAASAAIDANEARRLKRLARVKAAEAEEALAKKRIEVAQADLKKAREQVAFTTIRAPFDGVITRRLVDHGVLSNPTVPLLTVMQQNRVRVLMDVPQRDVGLLDARESNAKGIPDSELTGSVGQGGVNRPDDVELVQTMLKRVSQAPLKVTGKFNPATAEAIKAFQKGFMSSADGRVAPGSATWKNLVEAYNGLLGGVGDPVLISMPVLNKGIPENELTGSVGQGGVNSPDDVELVQTMLKRVSKARLKVTGKFSPATAEAIKAFQKGFMSSADGRVAPGSATWKNLVEAYNGLLGGKFEGTITRISHSLDPVTRTMRAEVELKNPYFLLKPGMFGTAEVVVEDLPSVITVPASAIVRKGEGDVEVFIVANPEGEGEERHGVLRNVKVVLGIDDGKEVEIKAGLTGDELVVARGASVMRPDDAVLAIEAP